LRVDINDLYEGPRYEKRAKHRKLNRIINICLFVILVVILFFLYQLFFGNRQETTDTTARTEISKNEQSNSDATNQNNDKNVSTKEESEQSTGDSSQNSGNDSNVNSLEGNEITNETSEDPNVMNIIKNKSWKPIGTEQTEPHIASYDSSSQDWKEMLQAIEYATGLKEDNWILWRLGNGGSAQQAIAVITSRDIQSRYRVFLEWIPSEGWLPLKIEELASIEEYRSQPKEIGDTDSTSSNDEENSEQ
jgi:hypothetical protein